jgi:hypothetical protein
VEWRIAMPWHHPRGAARDYMVVCGDEHGSTTMNEP